MKCSECHTKCERFEYARICVCPECGAWYDADDFTVNDLLKIGLIVLICLGFMFYGPF